MLSPSGSILPPNGTITQEMRVVSTSKVPTIFNIGFLVLHLKLFLTVLSHFIEINKNRKMTV